MPPKHPLLQKCLALLETLPHLKVETEVEAMPYIGETALADGLIGIDSPQGRVTYVVEIKSNVTAETLASILDYLHTLRQRLAGHQRLLLISEKLSKAVTKRLVQENLEFIDTTGNCFLNSPALYLLTSNAPLDTETSINSLDITTSALQLMYALLQMGLTEVPKSLFDEIAQAAGISLKSVKILLDRLHQLKYLQRQPNQGYLLMDKFKFLERWELGYSETLRPKLLIGTYTPMSGKHFSAIKDEMISHAQEEGYLIGGELAGAITTKYLDPIGATLHLPEGLNPTSLYLKLKLKPDKQGKIIFIRQFGSCNIWENGPAPMLADPLLIHAEMMAITTDERIQETNNLLFKDYLSEWLTNEDP